LRIYGKFGGFIDLLLTETKKWIFEICMLRIFRS